MLKFGKYSLAIVFFINMFRLRHAGQGHCATIQMHNKAAGTSIRHLVFRQNGSAFTNTPAPLAVPPCAGPYYLVWGACQSRRKDHLNNGTMPLPDVFYQLSSVSERYFDKCYIYKKS